jgi:hypothetical protein
MAIETLPPQQGKPSIKFHKGGLHESLGVAADKKIPKEKIEAALSGSYGDKAQKQAQFAKNVLVGSK